MLEVEYAIAAILCLLTGSILVFVGWGLFHDQIKALVRNMGVRCMSLIDKIFYWTLDFILGKPINRKD